MKQISGKPFSLSCKKFGNGKSVLCSLKMNTLKDETVLLSLGKKAESTLAKIIFAKKLVCTVDKDTFKSMLCASKSYSNKI